MSYKWFRSVALIVVLFGMLWIITVSSVFAQDMLPQATPPNAVTGESLEEAQTIVPQPDWETYTSPVFGFSFDYPQGWAVDIPAFTPGPDQYGYVITVRPTSDTDLADSKIEIANTNIEFAEGRSFERWVAVHDQAEPVFRDPPTINILGNYKLATRGKPTQIVHVRTTWANFQAESVWINHGRLAYVFNTNSQTDASSDMLMKMVSSVRFAPNAPSSLNELYGTQRSWPSAEEMVLQIENSPKGAATSSECDIVCQDAKASLDLKTEALPTHPPSKAFIEQERAYRENLEKFAPPSADMYEGVEQGGKMMPEGGNVLEVRKALPSNWWAPISVTGTTTKDVGCVSDFHGAPSGSSDSSMAIDIRGVGETTSVYAAQSGTVIFAEFTAGYGNLVEVATAVNVANESRTYVHYYAHLSSISVVNGAAVTRGQTKLGVTGNTGNNSTGAHLHFHVRLNWNPVDLSPMVGFTPNLNYPTADLCGRIEDKANSPLIIEPVTFTQRYQPRSNHFWYCWTYRNRTTECYLESAPNDASGWDPLVYSQSPELRYTNVYIPQAGTYYIWVCGWGGSYNDDSLHMGYNDALQATSDRISFFHPDYWLWSGRTMDLVNGVYQPASFTSVTAGDRTFNVWAREDGMRIDRILLTRSSTFPIATIRCGGY